MATFNGCDRIIKSRCLFSEIIFKNWITNYSVTSIKICHIVCALNIFLFFLKHLQIFFQHLYVERLSANIMNLKKSTF